MKILLFMSMVFGTLSATAGSDKVYKIKGDVKSIDIVCSDKGVEILSLKDVKRIERRLIDGNNFGGYITRIYHTTEKASNGGMFEGEETAPDYIANENAICVIKNNR